MKTLLFLFEKQAFIGSLKVISVQNIIENENILRKTIF